MHRFNTSDDNSRAAKGLETEHRSRDAFDSPVVVLNDIVEILCLTQRDGQTAVILDAEDSGRVGTALVDGDFIRRVVQANGAFEKRPRYSMISLGAQQEVNRVATFINSPVELFPLAGNLDVRFVHARTSADWPLATAVWR